MPPKYKFAASDIIRLGKIEEEAFEQLRSWCNDQKLSYVTDEQLVHFLLSNYNVVEDAQRTILWYFRCKSHAPELFTNLYFEDRDVQKAATVVDVAIIPNRGREDEVVFFGRLFDTCYYHFHLACIVKFVFMMFEMSIITRPANGIILVIDMDGSGFMHLTRARIGVIQKLFQFVQQGLPCKIHQVHILNTVSFIDKIILLIKPFISQDLFGAIQFHPRGVDLEQALGDLPNDCIPEEYGGSLPTLKTLTQNSYKEMAELRSFYAELEDQVRRFKKSRK